MATITENLNTIKTIKSDIKNAINNKGGNVTDNDGFATYAMKIANIPVENETDVGAYKIKLAYSGFSQVPMGLNFSNVTDASSIFYYCRNLTSFDCSRFQSPLVNVDGAFSECRKVVLSNVNSINLSQCTQMYNTFKFVKSITDSNLNDWDFSNMQILADVFTGVDLGTLDLSGWDMSNIIDISGLFSSAKGTLNITGWNTASLQGAGNAFSSTNLILDVPLLDFGSYKNTGLSYPYPFGSSYYTNPNITNLGGFKDLGKGYTTNDAGYSGLNLSTLPNLTYESAMNVINNLYDMNLTSLTITPVLTLKSTVYNLLSDEDKAIATNKRWTITSV